LEKGDLGNYKVTQRELKGLAETPNPFQVVFNLNIEGASLPVSIPLTYRMTDRVEGEVVAGFQLLPKITTKLS
ncbi:MAG: hypothetical protein ACPHIT_04515, partial [Flavobacteriaceae bacterium]